VNDPAMRRVAAFFLFIAAILIAVVIAAVRNISRSVASNDWVNQTNAIVLEVQSLASAVQAGDGALRTFVLSGHPRDRTASRDAFIRAGEHAEIASALTRSNPALHQPCLEVAELAKAQSTLADQVIAAVAAQGVDAGRQLLADSTAFETLQEMERKADRLKSDVLALLAERDTAAYLQAERARWTVFGGAALDVLLLAGVAWLIRDDIRARRRAAEALREANVGLESKVAERTTELSGANARLLTEKMETEWANQALVHQVRYNEMIIDSITDLVFVLTKTLRISRVNPAVVHQTGFQPTDLINQPLGRFVQLMQPADQPVPFADPSLQALKDGRELRDRSAIVVDRLGRRVSARFSLMPLRDGDQVVGGIVTMQLAAAPAAEDQRD
jgi:PAS domain-containing protein